MKVVLVLSFLILKDYLSLTTLFEAIRKSQSTCADLARVHGFALLAMKFCRLSCVIRRGLERGMNVFARGWSGGWVLMFLEGFSHCLFFEVAPSYLCLTQTYIEIWLQECAEVTPHSSEDWSALFFVDWEDSFHCYSWWVPSWQENPQNPKEIVHASPSIYLWRK